MSNVEKALATQANPLYAVLVDFKAIFDSTPRNKIMLVLIELGVPMNGFSLLSAVPEENKITIDD